MSRRKRRSRFVQFFTNIGNYIFLFFQLQLYWVLFSLRGLIVGGIFPALSGVVNILYLLFQEEDVFDNVWQTFKETYRENFKEANIVGYICTIALGVLYVDFRVNEAFLQSLILQFLLIVLTLIVVLTIQYTFTVLVRYEFNVKNIFKQAFFVSLSAPVSSIASLLGLVVMIWILQSIPLLSLFFGVPLIMLPIVWFTYAGILDAENKRNEAGK